jgi:hypothetical protein
MGGLPFCSMRFRRFLANLPSQGLSGRMRNLSGKLVLAGRFRYDSPLRRVDVPFLEVFTSGASQASNKHD